MESVSTFTEEDYLFALRCSPSWIRLSEIINNNRYLISGNWQEIESKVVHGQFLKNWWSFFTPELLSHIFCNAVSGSMEWTGYKERLTVEPIEERT